MLSVKLEGIKYHFLSLWYDSIWDSTLVFQTIGEHYQKTFFIRPTGYAPPTVQFTSLFL